MYGAVLWADRCTKRALIWCEDHGELAFFDGEPSDLADTCTFAEGDLVAFKIRNGSGLRLAFDMKVVASEEYPSLSQGLREAAPEGNAQMASEPPSLGSKILPFQRPITADNLRDVASRHPTGCSETVSQFR